MEKQTKFIDYYIWRIKSPFGFQPCSLRGRYTKKMKADEFVKTPGMEERIKRISSDAAIKSTKEVVGGVTSLATESYNAGFVCGISFRKEAQNKSDIKKSKELTNLTPSRFRETETCKQLVDLITGVIETHSDGNVLDLGYDMFLQETAEKALQIAYASGITAGFGIAADPLTSSIFVANEERILKQGLGDNK